MVSEMKIGVTFALLKKRIIIINFAFGKKGNVGGRRWRHFSTFLEKDYDSVFILTEKSKECIEEQHPSVHVIPFFHFFQSIKKIDIPIIRGIMYRFSLMISKWLIRGNYFDNSYFVGKSMSRWMRKHFAQNLKEAQYTVIISMGPFQTALPLLSLKKEFPQVTFILDYRDPWSQNTLAFGIKHLSEKRKKIEQRNEWDAIQMADGIIAVDEAVLAHWLPSHPFPPYRIISNGMSWREEINTTQNEKITLLFAGTFYEDTQDLIQPFIKELIFIKAQHPEALEHFEWKFIGHIPTTFREEIQRAKIPDFTFSAPIDSREILAEQLQSDLGINIVHKDFSYSINSKFLETLGAKKKTFYIGWAGSTSRFIEEQQIGFVWHPGIDLMEVLQKIYESKVSKQLMVTPNPTLNQLTFEEQYKKFNAFLNELTGN
jgi:hypothetical protein